MSFLSLSVAAVRRVRFVGPVFSLGAYIFPVAVRALSPFPGVLASLITAHILIGGKVYN